MIHVYEQLFVTDTFDWESSDNGFSENIASFDKPNAAPIPFLLVTCTCTLIIKGALSLKTFDKIQEGKSSC